RSPRGAADQVRAGHQSQDLQSSRAHDPAVPAAAGGPGDPVGRARPARPTLVAALGFGGCSMPSYDRTLWALRTWLDSWPGIGHVAVGMPGRALTCRCL